MNEKKLLVVALTLLFCCSKVNDIGDSYKHTVNEAIAYVKLPEDIAGVDRSENPIKSLRNTIAHYQNNPGEINREDILQRVRIDVGDEEALYQGFQIGLDGIKDESDIKNKIIFNNNTIKHFIKERKLKTLINKANSDLNYKSEQISLEEYITELRSKMEELEASQSDEKDPAIISQVNLNDKAAVTETYKEAGMLYSEELTLKTGWIALNRALRGGIRRGDEVVIGALQHQYKTGFSLTLFKQLCIYNTPYIVTPGKKPLMIRISFEDSLAMNLDYLYNNIRQNITRKVEDTSDISEEEKADCVIQELKKTGYDVEFLRVDPSGWSYKDIINKLLWYEGQGYEIHCLMLDYLAQVPTTGCNKDVIGGDVRELYRRLRNFCNPRKISMITPHQLSTEAKQLIRDGKDYFVKQLPGKGYYDKCKTVDNEVDIELFIHIETVNGVSYLTVQRGKHRLNGICNEKDLYFCLPFLPEGCILDDYGLSDSSCKKPGAGPAGSGNENPFWDIY